MVTFAFGLLKLEHMILHKNPNVTTNTEKVEAEDTYSLGSDELMMAFALGGEGRERIEYDPRYVRWVADTWYYTGNPNDQTEVKTYPLHPCTDAELS